MNSSKTKEILNIGVNLSSIGINNWALTKQQVLCVLNDFNRLGVGILGGDVCELINGCFQLNYDNWHCDRLINESNVDFVIRSIEETRNYIENYNSEHPGSIFFILVPQ